MLKKILGGECVDVDGFGLICVMQDNYTNKQSWTTYTPYTLFMQKQMELSMEEEHEEHMIRQG